MNTLEDGFCYREINLVLKNIEGLHSKDDVCLALSCELDRFIVYRTCLQARTEAVRCVQDKKVGPNRAKNSTFPLPEFILNMCCVILICSFI